MLVVEFQPLGEVVEGGGIGEVVDEEAEVGVLEVAGDEATEAFLPSSVPELKAVGLVAIDEVFDEKVDADGSLGMAASTL